MLSWLNFEDCAKLKYNDAPAVVLSQTVQTRMRDSVRKSDLVEGELVGYRIADELETEIETRLETRKRRPPRQKPRKPKSTASSSLRPTDDAFISSKNMELNFGTIDMLQYNSEDDILLRFDLGNFHSVSKAVLELYPVGGKCSGLEANFVLGGWKEELVSWFTAPSARGPRSTQSSSTCRASQWVQVDVSRAVEYALSVKRLSHVTLRISGNESSDRGVFASKEYRNGQFSPRLEIRAKGLKDPSATSKLDTLSSNSNMEKGKNKPKNKPNKKPGKNKPSKPKKAKPNQNPNKKKSKPNNKPAKPLGKKPKPRPNNKPAKPLSDGPKPRPNNKPAKPLVGKKPKPRPNKKPSKPQVGGKPKPKPKPKPEPSPSKPAGSSTDAPVLSNKEKPVSKPSGESSSASNSSSKQALKILDSATSKFSSDILLYESPGGGLVSSDVYKFPDFLNALEVMNTKGVAGFYFYLGDGSTNGHMYGLVNVAAFFAQSMKETIKVSAEIAHVLVFRGNLKFISHFPVQRL